MGRIANRIKPLGYEIRLKSGVTVLSRGVGDSQLTMKQQAHKVCTSETKGAVVLRYFKRPDDTIQEDRFYAVEWSETLGHAKEVNATAFTFAP